MLGPYYFKDKLNGTFINEQFPQIVRNVTPNITRPKAAGFYSQLQGDTRSLAFYGQASYALTEKLKLTGGVHWTRDSKNFRFANTNAILPLVAGVLDATAITLATGPIPESSFGVQGAATNCSYVTIPLPRPGFQCLASDTTRFNGATFNTATFEKVTWRVGLDYQVSDDNLLYASASTGFSSGGFNGSQAAAALGRETFAPQTVTAFEIGSKNRFANNTAQLNLSAFYNRYSNLQEQRQIPVGNSTLSIIESSGRARSYGAELEAVWRPVQAFTFNASFAYLNARYTQYDQVAAPFGTSILVPDATALTPTVVNGVTIAPAG